MLPNSEWILLAILAVILLKPDDIPAIARLLGKLAIHTNQLWNDLTGFNAEHLDLKKQKLQPFNCAPQKARIQPCKD